MSIIIHGPQGCGKSLHGEQLRRHFKLTQVVGEDDAGFPLSLYGQVLRDPIKFKSGNTLYLTSEAPPPALRDARRVISFVEAMHEVQTAPAGSGADGASTPSPAARAREEAAAEKNSATGKRAKKSKAAAPACGEAQEQKDDAGCAGGSNTTGGDLVDAMEQA
jgi:hypothetical protein